MKLGIYSRAGQIANSPTSNTILAEYNASDPGALCGGISTTQTVYALNSSTIASAFSTNENIYADSSLTTQASTGFYTDTIGTTNYNWENGIGWVGSFPC